MTRRPSQGPDPLESGRHHDLAVLRQRAMLEASNAFAITDGDQPDNPIIDVNPAFTALTGYRREEILGRNCRFLQGPETDPAAVAVLREAIATDHPQTVTLLNYRADGTTFWNEVTVSPLSDPDGGRRYYVGIQRDVSSRIAAADLSQSLEAEQSRTQLTTAVMHTLRHELKSPLSIICGYTELLLDARAASITAEQTADLEMILRSGRHLEHLLTAMLDLAQLRAGTLAFTWDNITVAPLLARLHAEFAPRAAAKQVDLQMDVPPTLDVIHGDPVRLYQALAQLLDNAVRFTDQGSVMLTVTERPSHLMIQMTDTGRGMPPETLQRLFEGLSTGEHGLRREFGGLGIGGALASELIVAQGGTITAESTLGSGTTIMIMLPRSMALPQNSAQPRVRSHSGEVPRVGEVPGDRDRAISGLRGGVPIGNNRFPWGHAEDPSPLCPPSNDCSDLAGHVGSAWAGPGDAGDGLAPLVAAGDGDEGSQRKGR